MSVLDRKLGRELWQMRWQVLAIVLVVACGIASYIAMLTTQDSLVRSQATYYADQRFAEVFAQVTRAPRSLARRVEAIPGVATVMTRVVERVTLDVPGLAEPASGLVVSIPAGREPALSGLFVRAGRWPSPERGDEVLVSETFAEANRLGPGDHLRAMINGRRQVLTVVGVALSPEYTYQLAPGSLLPDNRRFGVLWMVEEHLAAAFDMSGAFNDLSLSLAPGAAEAAVIERLDPLLAAYGGRGAHGRELQTSHHFLSEELKQLRSMGTAVPAIFLGVAAFLLHVVIGRLIGVQREQIAALKALGYSNAAIGGHYLKLVGVIVLLGSVLGVVLGLWGVQVFLAMYQPFFRFPDLRTHLEAGTVLGAVAVSTAAGVAGTIGAVRRAVRLPPAEAMRPAPPAIYRRGVLDRLGFTRLLEPSERIVLRNLGRRPIRTLMSSLGIALAMAILVVGSFSFDSLVHVMQVGFERVERYDVMVHFVTPQPRRALHDLAALEGVLVAEPMRMVPVRASAGSRSRRLALEGLPEGGDLRRVLDRALRPYALPEDGLLMTAILAERLGVRVGDRLAIEVLEGAPRRREVVVAGLVDEPLGVQLYMRLDAVDRLLGEPRISGARLAVDPARQEGLYRRLKELPAVAAVTLRTAALELFGETSVRMQWVTTLVVSIFASVIAVGVVYNGARVILAERSWELASLRVIGMSRAEVSRILLGELAVQVAAALPIGAALGYVFAAQTLAVLDVELFRFELVIYPRTYLFAAGVVTGASALTALAVRRKVDHLDLVAVLKTRE